MVISSFSKVNLGLKIGNIRDDGFHEVDMVTVFTSLCDVIQISKIKEREIVVLCTKDICKTEENLAYKACKIIFDMFGLNCGVKIKINKNIPDGAGLGGGSSNAAAVLCSLIKMFSLSVPSAELVKIGSKLGSDVPMFLYSGVLRCSGRGEIVKKICDPPLNFKILIKNQGFKINTREAYRKFDEIRGVNDLSDRVDDLVNAVKLKDLDEICKCCFNDFEIMSDVQYGWHLSGSGSSLFKIVDRSFKMKDKNSGENIIECFPVKYGVKIEDTWN